MDIQSIRTSLKNILANEMNLENVTADSIDDEATLFGDEGLGLDSLDAVELVVLVERHYGVVIADAETARQIFQSVDTLANHIHTRQN